MQMLRFPYLFKIHAVSKASKCGIIEQKINTPTDTGIFKQIRHVARGAPVTKDDGQRLKHNLYIMMLVYWLTACR